MTRSTAPPSGKAGHSGPRSGNPARNTAWRTLSWSSWATHPPGATSWFHRPSGGARHQRAGSSSPWWSLRWPSSAPCTPPSPGGRLCPPGNRGRVPVPDPIVHGLSGTRGPHSSPRRLPPWLLRQPRRFRAGPRGAGAAAIRARPTCGSRAVEAGSCGASPCRRGGGKLAGGLGGVGGGSGPPCGVRCCRWPGDGGGRAAPASAGCRSNCTVLPGLLAAGTPRPPSPVMRLSLPAPSPCPVLPARGGPCHPPPPCPWAPSLPPAPGSGSISPTCPPACVSCPSLCDPRPCLSCWRPCPSRVPTRAPCRALCPSFRWPCPCLSRAPALSCCCLHWRPARAPALPRCSDALALPLCPSPCAAAGLHTPLAPALLLRLPPSLGRPPPLAPCPRGWHTALRDCRPRPHGPRPAAAAAA